jgi:hypothetical protein
MALQVLFVNSTSNTLQWYIGIGAGTPKSGSIGSGTTSYPSTKIVDLPANAVSVGWLTGSSDFAGTALWPVLYKTKQQYAYTVYALPTIFKKDQSDTAMQALLGEDAGEEEVIAAAAANLTVNWTNNGPNDTHWLWMNGSSGFGFVFPGKSVSNVLPTTPPLSCGWTTAGGYMGRLLRIISSPLPNVQLTLET